MTQSLLAVYAGDSVERVSKQTLKALRDRDLLGVDNKLTDFGRLYAISTMPLAKQCSEISLEYETVRLSYEGRPEHALLAHYRSLGYVGISAEGIGVFTVLKALMLDKLAKYNSFNDRADACTRYLEAQLAILKDKAEQIIKSISSVSKARYVGNFHEIISYPFIASEYPELSMEFATAMYDAIGTDVYIAVAKKVAEDPYTYRNGWPDLTLVKKHEVLFIEVKTNDKLHESQLVTIPIMRDIMPFPFRVCRITKLGC